MVFQTTFAAPYGCNYLESTTIESKVFLINIAELVINGDQSEYIRKLRGDAERYCKRRPSHFADKSSEYFLQQVVSAFLCNHQSIPYSPTLISLCGPFVVVFNIDTTAYLALGILLDKISINGLTRCPVCRVGL
jgi:hypothetical protein